VIIGPGCHVTDCNRMKCADSTADATGDVLLKLSARHLQNLRVDSGAQPTRSLVLAGGSFPRVQQPEREAATHLHLG
jgi:hypothetical protein